MDAIRDEIYPSCNMAIIGKIKFINETQLIRPMEGQDRVIMEKLDKNSVYLEKLIKTLANNLNDESNNLYLNKEIIKKALLNYVSNKKNIHM